MARHGRLSKGCGTCRKRKIKCDRELPTCSQCKKAGWTCPQYGDIVDRMFQHHYVESNDKSKQIISHNSTQFKETHQNKPAATFASYSLAQPLISISSTIDDIAVEYFLANHVFHESTVARGHFEFLTAYALASWADKTFSISLRAAALAAYAHRFQYPILIKRSKIYYGQALTKLRVDLGLANPVTTTSSIIAMALLGTFETISDDSLNSLIRNGVHMRGLMKAISSYSHELMTSNHGIQLFLQMSWCRLVACILRSLPIPEELARTRKCAAKVMDTNDPSWKLSEMMIKVADFRAHIKNRVLWEQQNIVPVALKLDQELVELGENMPTYWRYQIRFSAHSNSTTNFEPYYHVYPDLWIACIWNFIRSCRLILHKGMCPQLVEGINSKDPAVSCKYEYLYRRSNAVVEALASDICATVPQFCGVIPASSDVVVHKSGNPPQLGVEEGVSSNGVPQIASMYHLLWPMISAGQLTQSAKRRDWIIQRCRHIGNITGIQQAFAVADLVESQDDIDNWFELQGGEKLLA